ncbi:MAG: biotin/lipoyl-containing protein [Armatimonadota bacterium]|nr:biotin/lipoyl-containing protein [Armatimonadota bacterium]MDR7439815.1 biotin/lipoyl-containing protein [Armatimonadota bacterium]MDR7563707.1 biotin/lipoyl-containing protein [Armatimonadota bacterium]MDR7568548.1 biotin/lipoyl-containing protein [Armatimonadota bacterium]MDR7601655.1 biotin/lipoyl-containing protein [Armatimonadota bacterium]
MRYVAVLALLFGIPGWVRWIAAAPSPDPDLVRATIGGLVVEAVSVGDRVREGDPLVYVRTSTKPREVAARAPRSGVVAEVLVRPGQRIQIGDPVVRLAPR